LPPTGPAPFTPLGVYSSPPPAEATHIRTIRVQDERAARAGAWITHRLNDAMNVWELYPDEWPGVP